MNTNPSAALQENTFIKAVDSTDEEFFIFNSTSGVMYVKFSDNDSTPPLGKEGAILILPYKGLQRGTIEGYPWICGTNDTKASITE